MSEKITIPQIDLPPDQYLIKDYGQSITLFQDHILIDTRADYKCIKDEDPKLTEDLAFHNIYAAKKEIISFIELYHHNKWNTFNIVISLNSKQDIVFPHKKFLDAKALFDKLYNWKFK